MVKLLFFFYKPHARVLAILVMNMKTQNTLQAESLHVADICINRIQAFSSKAVGELIKWSVTIQKTLHLTCMELGTVHFLTIMVH